MSEQKNALRKRIRNWSWTVLSARLILAIKEEIRKYRIALWVNILPSIVVDKHTLTTMLTHQIPVISTSTVMTVQKTTKIKIRSRMEIAKITNNNNMIIVIHVVRKVRAESFRN